MLNKWFGNSNHLPRQKVDAVVKIIDRYLSEEADPQGLQTDKQTMHSRDLPLEKREALINEVFSTLGETGKK